MRRGKAAERDIARARISRPFQLAEGAALEGRLDRAGRYLARARRLGMTLVVRLRREHGRRVRRACGAYLLRGARRGCARARARSR